MSPRPAWPASGCRPPCCATPGPRPGWPSIWPGRPRPSSGSPATCTAARRAAPTPPCGCCTSWPTGRLRRHPDPRQRHRGPAPDPEPGRPRGRHPAQRLRLRPEPRLVRPHPARDRRQARAAAPLPADALHRRPRDGRRDASSSRPTPTRSTTRSPTSRSTGSTTCTARRMAARVHAPGHPVLQPRRLRPVLHGLRRHRADDRRSSPPA